ncbi:RDD family protein [Vibrio sp. B1Z05]|uniref:RDD family protein n=1 Tax=Vibrio sp. B1Z05 TaxID=2654980 RepID=UPI00128B6893|nr:RDD family protein [Vibrio sp. B1Z05]MPW35304.1 RDD family protein [Vibrio sp. B1Z05]
MLNHNIEYAGAFKRVLAWIIDSIILVIPIFIFVYFLELNVYQNTTSIDSMVAGGMSSFEIQARLDATVDALSNLVGFLISLLYFSFMDSSKKQATFGKLIMGIKIITKTGGKLSFFRAMWRFISKIFSSLILFIGLIMIPFTKKKQGLHDFMAGSLVVKG